MTVKSVVIILLYRALVGGLWFCIDLVNMACDIHRVQKGGTTDRYGGWL